MVSKELFRLKLVSKDLFGKNCFKKDFERFKAPYSLKSLENNPGDGC